MAKKSKSVPKSKPVAKRGPAKIVKFSKSVFPKPAPGELVTLLDFVRFAVSRFTEAKLVFAHGTTDPVAEAAFLICVALHLHPDQFEAFATARVTSREAKTILDLIEQRVTTQKPAAYLVNKIYMRGLPFYVDERTIVPRSFIGELLDLHFSGHGEDSQALIEDPASVSRVLDLCTGSGCLAILASGTFLNAAIDAADISKDALAVAARNVADYGLEDRDRASPRQFVRSRRRYALRSDYHQSTLCRRGGHDGLAARMSPRAKACVRRRCGWSGYRAAHSGQRRTPSSARRWLVV